jgi:hypothetical protein
MSTERTVENNCPICLEPFANRTWCITKCGHAFCSTCLDNWTHQNVLRKRNTLCPLCQQVIVEMQYMLPPQTDANHMVIMVAGGVSEEEQHHRCFTYVASMFMGVLLVGMWIISHTIKD